MPKPTRFQLGDRVRISAEASWACAATGTIALPPESLVESIELSNLILHAEGHPTSPAAWEGPVHVTEIGGRRVVEWWVMFDEPQFDDEGDGPLAGAAFPAEMIDVVSTSA